MRMILNPFKLLKIGKKPTTPRKKLEIPKSPEQLIKKHGRLANQGELVIKSMLMIQESIPIVMHYKDMRHYQNK